MCAFIFSFALFPGLSHMFSFPPFLRHAQSPHFNVFILAFMLFFFFSPLLLLLAAEKSVLESFKSISFVFLFLSVMLPLQQPLLILVNLPLPAAWESTTVKEYKLSPVEEINLLDPEKGIKA